MADRHFSFVKIYFQKDSVRVYDNWKRRGSKAFDKKLQVERTHYLSSQTIRISSQKFQLDL